jgi:hypothetical protein
MMIVEFSPANYARARARAIAPRSKCDVMTLRVDEHSREAQKREKIFGEIASNERETLNQCEGIT